MDKKNLFLVVARIIFYAILVVISTRIIALDAGSNSAMKFSENSRTEWSQFFYLLAALIIFIFIFSFSKQYRAVSVLMGGGMMTLMIREMDAFFDQIYHGAWFPFALAVIIVTFFLAYKQRRQLGRNIQEYLKTPAFGIFIAGALEIFVFSRLFGTKNVWRAMFNVNELEPVQRWVKNAAEEGSELFGYTLLFIAAIEFLVFVYRKNPDQN